MPDEVELVPTDRRCDLLGPDQGREKEYKFPRDLERWSTEVTVSETVPYATGSFGVRG